MSARKSQKQKRVSGANEPPLTSAVGPEEPRDITPHTEDLAQRYRTSVTDSAGNEYKLISKDEANKSSYNVIDPLKSHKLQMYREAGAYDQYTSFLRDLLFLNETNNADRAFAALESDGFKLLNDILSPLIPPHDRILELLVASGVPEQVAPHFVSATKDHARSLLKLFGEFASVDEANSIFYKACEFASKLYEAGNNGQKIGVSKVLFEQSSGSLAERNRSEYPTAEAFLKVAYDGRLGIDGDLTMTGLKRLDPQLAADLEGEFVKNPDGLRALLPGPTERANAKLLKALGYIPMGDERQKALTVLARGGQPGARGPYRKDGNNP